MRNPPNDALDASDSIGPERTCVLTRRKGTRDELIRLALGPDGSVAPDVRARAPGRGAWISVGRAELEGATANGKLKGALQRAFKTSELSIPTTLASEPRQRFARPRSTGSAWKPAPATSSVLRQDRGRGPGGQGADADPRRRCRTRRQSQSRPGASRRRSSSPGTHQGGDFPSWGIILSMALGRDNVVHIALTDSAAASRVQHALSRWCAFTDPDSGPKGGAAPCGTARPTI